MAKTNTKSKTKSKVKDPDFEVEVADGIWLSIYERRNKNDSFKITLDNAFIIFGSVIQSDKGTFLSYPHWIGKNGEYHNQAYCFDSDVNEEIRNVLEDYYG